MKRAIKAGLYFIFLFETHVNGHCSLCSALKQYISVITLLCIVQIAGYWKWVRLSILGFVQSMQLCKITSETWSQHPRYMRNTPRLAEARCVSSRHLDSAFDHKTDRAPLTTTGSCPWTTCRSLFWEYDTFIQANSRYDARIEALGAPSTPSLNATKR